MGIIIIVKKLSCKSKKSRHITWSVINIMPHSKTWTKICPNFLTLPNSFYCNAKKNYYNVGKKHYIDKYSYVMVVFVVLTWIHADLGKKESKFWWLHLNFNQKWLLIILQWTKYNLNIILFILLIFFIISCMFYIYICLVQAGLISNFL